jgi:hypothetical protein
MTKYITIPISEVMETQLGLHHFNPPLKVSSYKRDNEVIHQRMKSLGDKQCVQTLKDKGM